MLAMKTSFVGSDTDIKWCVVDADGKVLGRLASQIAMVLRGKHHPTFTPHADMGYRVAVINAEKIRVTGNKATDKTYFRYSGYPGGAKVRTFEQQMQIKPAEILRHAVKGMLPKNRLGRKLIKKLKIYVGPNHPHQAQRPGSVRCCNFLEGGSMAVEQYWGTGRRKTSVARVRVIPDGSGPIHRQ